MKIAIASGKGGTGKTFISTNLFWTVQNAGIPVTLVDCDAEEPNVLEFFSGELTKEEFVYQKIPLIDPLQCVYCGTCQEYCSYNAIICLPKLNHIQVIEELCHDCGACYEACEIDAISEKEKLLGSIKIFQVNSKAQVIEASSIVGVYSPVPIIRKAIQQADERHLILLDSPPGISCPFIATVDDADFVILVTEPTPFGLNDLKLTVETLKEVGKPFGVIVNRSDLGNREVFDWLEQSKIPLLLEIPFDRDIARIYSQGKCLTEEIQSYRETFLSLLKSIENRVHA